MLKKISLLVGVVIVCGGSLLCSVMLWAGEQSSIFAAILFGAFFGAIEICKFSFFPIAAQLIKNNRLAGVSLYSLAFVLLGLSIFATVAFLETGATQSNGLAKTTSTAFRAIESTVTSLDAQIKTLNANMLRDSQLDFRARAVTQSEQLQQLQGRKERAVSQLINFKAAHTSGVQSIFSRLSSVSGFDESNVRLTVYTGLAVIVDVCGIVCLLLLTAQPIRVTRPIETDTAKRIAATRARYTKKQAPTISETSLEHPAPFNSKSLKLRIADGEFGFIPVMRDIIKSEGVRHPTLKRIFDELIDDGLLVQSGRGFALVKS